MGWALQAAGHQVHFLAAHYAPVHAWNMYETASQWVDIGPNGEVDGNQLARSIHHYSKLVDIIVYSNEPNYPFRIIKENTDLPVIYDIHDFTSLSTSRFPEELEMEKWALEHADGFIVPSRGYLKKIRGISKKPSILVYSKVPQALYPQVTHVKSHPGLVYEGGLKGLDKADSYNYAYRNWAAFMQKVAEGLKGEDQIYCYSANDGEDFKEYLHDKIKISPPLLYNVLLGSLGMHTAGLVGTPYPVSDFQDSMPNKLFEYVSAGIPCVVVNSPEAKTFVEENELGLGISDATEVPDALDKLRNTRVHLDRWQYAMESEVPKLVELLREVACISNPRIIRQVGSLKTATDVALPINAGKN